MLYHRYRLFAVADAISKEKGIVFTEEQYSYCTMRKKDEPLDYQIPEYGLEALVSLIDDHRALIQALEEAGQRFSAFKRELIRPRT